MSNAKPQGGVKITRAKQILFTPPGILGYNNLDKPDAQYDKFSVDLHLNEAGVAGLIAKTEAECVAPLFPKWQTEYELPKAKRPDAAEFINERMRDPKDGKPFPERYIRFSVAASGKRKDNSVYTRSMAASAVMRTPVTAQVLVACGAVAEVVLRQHRQTTPQARAAKAMAPVVLAHCGYRAVL